MSVFAAPPAVLLPPRYSSTRPQPPPYKPALSKPLTSNSPSVSIPPPIYQTATSTTTTSSRSSSPAPSISTIAEPPQYASIVSAPKPKPQPIATRVRDLPTWKDPYVETDAEDSIYRFQQRNERQRAEPEEEESSNWCCGCFWVGPSMQQPWITHIII